MHELLTHSLALFLAQSSEVISEGRVIHGGHNWIVRRVRRCRRFQRLGKMFPRSKNSLLVEVGDCYREMCVFVLALSTLFAA